MKKILLFAAAIALFSSCRSYQMSTFSSLNIKKIDSTGVFKLENDSMIISYSFTGENSPLNVEIFNKLSEPMYINWERSALIIADKAYSYAEDEIKIEGTTSGISTQLSRRGDTFSDGTISATAKLAKNESFLPPHSKVSRTSMVLEQVNLNTIDKSAFKKVFFNDVSGEGLISAKSADFSAENSPLKFRSYLTLYTLKNNQPQPFTSQQEFFVSNVIRSGSNPNTFTEYNNNPGNIMISSTVTGYGKTMAVVGLVTAAGVLGATDAALNDKKGHK